LSNWMIWMGIAVLITLAANILRKRSRFEQD
jgi:LPXTG-motif cell wall-anchored protein